MDDPNINMEEYIRLEEEKARRHGRTFNWQTATFGKVKHYEDEDDCSINFETEFLAIVFDNTIILSKPKIRRISTSSAQETCNDQFPIMRITPQPYAICTLGRLRKKNRQSLKNDMPPRDKQPSY
nr:hypothetical protein [Tanacetum cinerariifolium]